MRKPSVAGDKAVRNDSDEPFARRINYAAAGDGSGIAAETHCRCERLLAARVAAPEGAVKIERNSRQIAEILEESEQREENCHRRQHNGNYPRENAVEAENERIMDNAGKSRGEQPAGQDVLKCKQRY